MDLGGVVLEGPQMSEVSSIHSAPSVSVHITRSVSEFSDWKSDFLRKAICSRVIHLCKKSGMQKNHQGSFSKKIRLDVSVDMDADQSLSLLSDVFKNQSIHLNLAQYVFQGPLFPSSLGVVLGGIKEQKCLTSVYIAYNQSYLNSVQQSAEDVVKSQTSFLKILNTKCIESVLKNIVLCNRSVQGDHKMVLYKKNNQRKYVCVSPVVNGQKGVLFLWKNFFVRNVEN